jgi:membrane protease YdiL (CAAX protease family)
LLLITQIPAALVGIAVLFAIAWRDPDAVRDADSPAVGVAMIVAVVVAHALIVLVALIALRATAGRHWTREVALRPPSVAHVLLALALLPAFMILGNGAAQLLSRPELHYPSLARPPEVAAFWGAVALVLLLAAVGQILCGLIGGCDWPRRWVAPLSREMKAGLSALLLAVAVGVGVGAYVVLLPPAAALLPPEASGLSGVEDLVKAMTGLPLPLVALAIGVMPGVSEELWCRAFLGRGLVGRYGVFWGVLMASFFFGAIHGDPRQATYAALMGVVLHSVYLMSRSLLVPMLLHFGNNALGIALTRVEPLKVLDSEEAATWHLFTAAGAVLVLCLVAFWQSRARLVGIWRPEHPGVSWPPPGYDTHVEAPMPSWPVALLVVVALAGLAVSLVVTLRAA